MSVRFPHTTHARQPFRRGAIGTTALALILGLAGCTGGGGGGGGNGGVSQSPQPSTASEAPAPTLPAGVTPTAIPTKVANEPASRRNVVLSNCAAADGGWGASGTATNPGKNNVSFDITVFFTTTSATVVNYARTTVDVKPGETKKWNAARKFAAPDQMLCVLRGVAEN